MVFSLSLTHTQQTDENKCQQLRLIFELYENGMRWNSVSSKNITTGIAAWSIDVVLYYSTKRSGKKMKILDTKFKQKVLLYI